MSVSRKLDFDLENLPVDVFELGASGLVVESLTSGHGMGEMGASTVSPPCYCSQCCSCCVTL
ncbi:thiomuracin/GE37468 family thiazolyl RiPP peptide [Sphaerisporangium corydalis]|uniref:Thiomuracin/GE37468 family thiazolyl RiPP peptide n=1 Tax=Sphaerisporangium corydalis TaxID=1441875 RepID=A0ABV9EBV3_9ACTN|nr:thiomuracin/GE37468 family thiazolyl RiPP peptide [Sphaerisporangium corydalis]